MIVGDSLKDAFEDAVCFLVEEYSDASELKDMLCEKLGDVIDHGACNNVDDAIYESTNSPNQENALSSFSRDIRDEAINRIADKYVVKLNK